MDPQQTYEAWKYAVPVMVFATLASVLVGYGWIKRKSSLGLSYFLLMLSMALWMLFYSSILMVSENSPEIGYVLMIMEYLMMVVLPLLWLFFSLDFANIKGWKSPGTFILLSIPTILLFLIAASGKAPNLLADHHTFLEISRPAYLERMLAAKGDRIFWTYVHITYSLSYFAIGTVLVIKALNNNPKVDLKQSVLLSLGVLVPWIGNITFIFKVSPIQKLDLAPFTFTLAGALLAWGLYYNRFLGLVDLARKVLVDRMMDGLIILDGQNWIMEINPAAQKIFKVTSNTIIGQPAASVFKPYPDIVSNLKYASRKHQEITVQIGSDTRYYDLDINPLFDNKGLVAGKILIFHDITSLKEAEIKLREAKSKAEQADSLKTAFLANMSHEIRTPMNAIIGFSNLLNDQTVSEEEKSEFIQHIKDSGNSLLQLIDDIIDISKLDAGQLEVTERIFSVPRILAELFSNFNGQLSDLGKTRIQLLLRGVKNDEDWWVAGDVDKIKRVLNNLLDNAVKFTHQGFIEFGYSMDPSGHLVFFVQDTGIGIAKEKQAMIFDRFARVVTGTRQEYGGTGLGLAICKGFTELMGGKIWVNSTPGSGSVFHFSVPVTRAENYRPPVVGIDNFRPVEVPVMAVPPVPPVTMEAEPQLIAAEAAPAPILTPPADLALPPDFPTEPGLIFNPEEMPVGGYKQDDLWGSQMILVLEPDEMSYLYIEMVLRKTKVNLVWTRQVREAVNFMERSNRIDLILVSSQLPDSTPMETMNVLRSQMPRVPVVAITPFEGSGLNRQFRELGCIATVSKPIKPEKLLSAIRLTLPS